MTEVTLTVDPEALFLDFFKRDQYRERLSGMAVTGNKSFVVNFDELLAAEPKLAQQLMDNPDDYLEYANRAAKAQLPRVRQNLPQMICLRRLPCLICVRGMCLV